MIRDYVRSGGNNTYVDVEVKFPRTHVHEGKALYTDYEVEVKTNHPCFPLFHSNTRRRYSEFAWLRSRLGLHDFILIRTPSLPRKQLIGRFKEGFLCERQAGLQKFMNRVVETSIYLQEPVLQLFLQTNLKPKDMDHYLKTRNSAAIRSLIAMLNRKPVKKEEQKTTISSPCYDFPLTKKLEKSLISGRGWSCQYGEVQSLGSETEDGDETGHMATLNAEVLPGGRLTLPTIPGSMEDMYYTNNTMAIDTLTVAPCHKEQQERRASWHGTSTDYVDFLLDDYDVIPMEEMMQVVDQNHSEAAELGYLDLTTTLDSLYSQSAEQMAFDY
ncbi:predicted protein [Nematostella vectensis]|uniref:Sorting nexin-3 n=1 Tax=Nematostella vectensis TaxID=45351 RepID=A7SFV3_NEMVE|nr:predicted protein [Nematostella vectensis]|eukprot:XP_001629456.1 predicted protein [Nematostella vectensis]